jgi:hypothetical protein
MPLLATDKGGSDIAPIPAGNYQAVCYGVIDIGTQPGGQFEPSHKVVIQFELPFERHDFKRDDKMVNLPRSVSATFTLSLGTKANLRKSLETWRNKQFTEEELKGFDLSKLIAANAMLSIIHRAGTGKNQGKVFANVNGIASLPKGTERKKLENKPVYFSFQDLPENTLPDFEDLGLPEWIQEMIKDSEEYRAIERKISAGGQPQTTATATAGSEDEDRPF